MNLAEISNSNQYAAVTGGRRRPVPYATYLEGSIQSARDASRNAILDASRDLSLAQSARQFNEEMALREEELAKAEEQALISSGIQTGEMALMGTYLAKKAGLFGAKEAGAAVSGGAAAGELAGTGAVSLPTAGATLAEGASLAEGALTAAPVKVFDTTLGAYGGATLAEGASGATLTGEVAGAGGAGAGAGGALSTGLSYGGPALAGAAAGYLVGGSGTGQDIGKMLLFGHGGERERGAMAAAAAGAATGAALMAWSGPGAAVGAVVGGVIGGIAGIFGCFTAGTKVRMADGTEKAVEELDLLDETLEGGPVIGWGKGLSDRIYLYRGIRLSAGHAVLENGRWIRVEDSHNAMPVGRPGQFEIIYPVVTANHLLIAGDRVFADYDETDQGTEVNDADRLATLNEQRDRIRYLEETYHADQPLREGETLRHPRPFVGEARMDTLPAGGPA